MPKRGLLIAGTIAILIVAGGASIFSYRGSPKYALNQIAAAANDGNRLRFQQYVDLDRFLPSAVDQLMSRAALDQMADPDASGFEMLGAALGGAMVDQMKPALIQALRSAILDAVEAGSPDRLFAPKDSAAGPSAIDVAEIGASTGTSPDGFVGVGRTQREGDVALVELNFRQAHLDTTLALTVRMERAGRRWRVVAPENLDSYMRHPADPFARGGRPVRRQRHPLRGVAGYGRVRRRRTGRAPAAAPGRLQLGLMEPAGLFVTGETDPAKPHRCGVG